MIEILNDTVDLYAGRKKKQLIKIVLNHLDIHTHKNTKAIHEIINWLAYWEDNFDSHLEEPTYFSMWEYFIMKNLLSEQLTDQNVKMLFFNHFYNEQFLMKFYRRISEDPEFQKDK